ncbi:MAG: uroporphyrinogen decarboxylase family protein [Dehalococcoidia bacterium]|nr:uroporphyrinogen decarboxylase family protein [Dehalococcoidia bacterium]
MGNDQMSHRERAYAMLAGKEVDRPAWSLWRHFYDQETSAEGLASAMLSFQQTNQFDFVKVNPRAQYHVEGWGVRWDYPGKNERPRHVEAAVKNPDDWRRLKALPPDAGALGEQLQALRLIKDGLKGEAPFIETIFNPISIAADLVESDAVLVDHLRNHPEALKEGLDTITHTFIGFARACLEIGADGIFFATTTLATRDILTEDEYATFARPYDLRFLAAIQSASFNVLHVCQSNAMLFPLSDYPVPAINWAATDPTNPSLAGAALMLGGKTLIGGIGRSSLTADTPEAVLNEVRRARAQTRGERWILGANCTIPTSSRQSNIDAVAKEIASLGV